MGKEVPFDGFAGGMLPSGSRRPSFGVASDGVEPYLNSLAPAGMRYLSMLSAEELVRSVLDGISRDGDPNHR